MMKVCVCVCVHKNNKESINHLQNLVPQLLSKLDVTVRVCVCILELSKREITETK